MGCGTLPDGKAKRKTSSYCDREGDSITFVWLSLYQLKFHTVFTPPFCPKKSLVTLTKEI